MSVNKSTPESLDDNDLDSVTGGIMQPRHCVAAPASKNFSGAGDLPDRPILPEMAIVVNAMPTAHTSASKFTIAACDTSDAKK
jgi:hypothetical protein